MRYSDYALITEDVPRLVSFYEAVFDATAEGDEVHSSMTLHGTGIAFYSREAAERDMDFDFSEYNGVGRMTVGFMVQDVDAEYERLKAMGGVIFVTTPKTYPWGARSVHFRDPDGNILCFRCLPHLDE